MKILPCWQTRVHYQLFQRAKMVHFPFRASSFFSISNVRISKDLCCHFSFAFIKSMQRFEAAKKALNQLNPRSENDNMYENVCEMYKNVYVRQKDI